VVSAEGGAVIYASHLVHDIERVADRVACLDGGRLEFEESLERLKGTVRRARAVFESEAPKRIELAGKIDSTVDGRVLSVVAQAHNGELDRLLRSLGATQVEVESIPLEEILVAYLRRDSVPQEEDHV